MDRPPKPYPRTPFADSCRLAHDLNNKLNVILGRCELLEEILPKDTSALKQVHKIQEAAQQMADQIAKSPCDVTRQRVAAAVQRVNE